MILFSHLLSFPTITIPTIPGEKNQIEGGQLLVAITGAIIGGLPVIDLIADWFKWLLIGVARIGYSR